MPHMGTTACCTFCNLVGTHTCGPPWLNAQDCCIVLDTDDATLLPAAAQRLTRVSAALPRMEAFVSAVCEAVYLRGGDALLPPALRGGLAQGDPGHVSEVWGRP